MFVFAAFVYGLVVGSFLNALVYRLHEKKSIAKGRSACPGCAHQLAVKDLVPVFSWIWLRGRCRYCRKPISAQYPLVELATALLFTWSYYVLTPGTLNEWLLFGGWLFILSSLIALTVYDLMWQLLPDKMTLPAISVALGMLLLRPEMAVSSLIAAFAAGGFFYLLASLAGGKLMGGGDVKLTFLMGLLLGGWHTVLALVLAFNLAAVVGVYLLATKRKRRGEVMPFGPYLAAAAVFSYLHGTPIIESYLTVAGLR